ncbi:Helicase [Paraburkholderia kururiensis]|uniref:helicase-related protein n=1 Tax=Paraburkholderia kururiensis TaxID=984307 RepID=UPI0039A768DD
MSSTPRPFQEATVAAAVECLTGKGSRRFLVADEVGLGKTTVAREVVNKLSRGGTKCFTVFYVTNNTRVSDQNASRLVDFLGEKRAKQRALSKVDRLSMIPLDQRPDDKELPSPLRIYSLAPQTSFPPEGTRPTPGAAVERAFLGFLLERAVPGVLEMLPDRFIQQRATVSWDGACRTAERLMSGIDPKLVTTYRKALKARFNPEGKRPRLRDRIVAAANTKPEARTLTVLRRLLAEACLEATPPDLIIFDEFQRFREMLTPAVGDRLGHALLGIGKKKLPILLLSATPYRLYGESWDGKDGPQAHEELFETIEFLTRSKETRGQAELLFASFGEILRAIGDAEGDVIDPVLKERAEATRDRIDTLLRPCIARTERPPVTGEDQQTHRAYLPITATDLRIFRHFAEPLTPRNRSAASAYWLSVPLPAQALGHRYKIADKIEFKHADGVPQLRSARRKSDSKDGWGSPKLRALQAIAKSSELALPWVAPSMYWWPLAGPWACRPAQKTLLFSRFRATPQSVAALVSLTVEDAYLGTAATSRRRPWESKRLAPQSGLPVMALFHPSPLLIRATDPLKGNFGTAGYALRTVTGQLRRVLQDLKIEVRSKPKKDAERARPLWNLLAAIERRSGDYAATQEAWRKTAGDEAVLGRIVADRKDHEPIDWISAEELRRLAEIALAAPAVAVGRALRRHFPAAVDADHIYQLIWFCWHRLRPYLDNRVFWGRLGKGNPTAVLLAAVRDGGLESVLDEHFWLAQGQADPSQLLEELASALHASLGWFTFRGIPTSSEPIRLRCHAAVPFSGTDSVDGEAAQRALNEPEVEAPPRSEGLRRAFNTPFWPHVLATTSIGQEGLDFHSWCRRIVHWDLPSNPVDLEQREGRISRYGGLLVRRPLGEEVRGDAVVAGSSGRSPWKEAAALGENRFPNETGLSPWWTFKRADVDRHVLTLSKSRDIARFDHLQRQRLLYRLALGQANQEDLVNHLARGSDEKIAELSALALDLRPRSADKNC